jgi:hypothetical protein
MRWSICPFLLAAALFAQTPDEFAGLHKYGADPHQPLSSAERGEFTYTITSVMQFARPYRLGLNGGLQIIVSDCAVIESRPSPIGVKQSGPLNRPSESSQAISA